MRTLKTTDEIIYEGGVIFDKQTKELIASRIIAAQRDALECAYEMLCIDGDIDSILKLLPKDK